MTEKELKLYKCWECGGRYYASEMITTDKKNEVGDFCKECWKDMGEKDEQPKTKNIPQISTSKDSNENA